eukprot:6973098-Pyramimonas_sp.AAC.1
MVRGLLDTHFGKDPHRAWLSLASEFARLWHVRPGRGRLDGTRLLTEKEVRHLHEDFTTRAARYMEEAHKG